jgi:hypothetical protein
MMYTAGKTSWADSGRRQALLALNLVGTVLVSYDVYVHDLIILFPAIAFILEILLSRPPIQPWMRKTLYACVAILTCSPFYIVLTLRYSQLQIMVVVLLAVFLGLLRLVRAPRAQTTATG